MKIDYEILTEDIRRGSGYNQNIFNDIFMNPIVKELPEYAGMYGLYAKFVVTDLHLFFVFGYDKEIINGEWVSHGKKLTPQCYIDKFGYIENNALFGLAYQYYMIENPVNLKYLEAVMLTMESLHNAYIDYDVSEPKFVYAATSSIANIENYRALTDNPFFHGEKGIELGKDMSRASLRNIAVYDFPITPDVKIGETAFTVASICRYTLNNVDLKTERKLWSNPDKWNDALYKYDLFSFYYEGAEDLIDFIAKRLKEVNVPYVIGDPARKLFNNFQDKLDKQIQDAVGSVNYNPSIDKTKVIRVTMADCGALYYAVSLWGLSQFTDEDIENGKKIAAGAQCIMPIPREYLTIIRGYLKSRNVLMGMADCDMSYDYASQNMLFVSVPATSNAILYHVVSEAWDKTLSRHHFSVYHTGDIEFRQRGKIPNAVELETTNYQMNGMPDDSRKIQEGGVDIESMKRSKYYVANHSNPLRLKAEKIASNPMDLRHDKFFANMVELFGKFPELLDKFS